MTAADAAPDLAAPDLAAAAERAIVFHDLHQPGSPLLMGVWTLRRMCA